MSTINRIARKLLPFATVIIAVIACHQSSLHAQSTLADRIGTHLERHSNSATVWVTKWIHPWSRDRDAVSETLEQVRDSVIADLRSAGIETRYDAEIDRFVADNCKTRRPGPPEARQLAAIGDSDLMLTISYREYRRRPTVLFALSTTRRTVWTERVVLQSDSDAASTAPRLPAQHADRKHLPFRVYNIADCVHSTCSESQQAAVYVPASTTAGRSTAAGQSKPSPNGNESSLRDAVLRFACDHLNQQVGDGECASLTREALQAAGARPASGYRLGSEVPIESVEPGDLLYFHNARFQGRQYWMQLGSPHHTAIVTGRNGDRITYLHQNFNRIRRVQFGEINLADLKSGRIRAFSPVTP